MSKLVIVESPTKAKTLKRFLGKDFIVESSVGHIRDLPSTAKDVPAKQKEKMKEAKEKWEILGVHVNEDFKPLYVVHADKKDKVKELRSLVKEADELLLATDEDREGEAISWHLLEVLKPKIPVKRMVFHEITKKAILAALDNTRELDTKLVEAQEARRILDRLYGFGVSPLLWKKVKTRLSAGRVQSVATRMIVEREELRRQFRPASYWDLTAEFKNAEDKPFAGKLVTIDGKRLASGKHFSLVGELEATDVVHLLGEEAERLRAGLEGAPFTVASTEEKPFTRQPTAPFITATLQQEGNRKLGFPAMRTMQAAQTLYENGFITYMRTDSVILSDEAVETTRKAIEQLYGDEYLPAEPRQFKNRARNVQEAHEAIRPVGAPFPSVEEVTQKLGSDPGRVYELIWKRTMASQMEKARGRRMVIRVSSQVESREVVFQANGSVIDFPGFLRAYVEGSDDPKEALDDKDRLLPHVQEGEQVKAGELAAEEHTTQPPARLTEATLIRSLREAGVGRPSTYASTIRAIDARDYTFKKGSALVPTWVAFAVVDLMRKHLPHLIDMDFTASMENRLDEIAAGNAEQLEFLRSFYFGEKEDGLKTLVAAKEKEIDAREVCSYLIGQDAEGVDMILRVGKYGPYLQRGEEGKEERASLPDGMCPDELTVASAEELLEKSRRISEPLGMHPDNGEPIYLKNGRFGPYVQLGEAKDADGKPKPEKPKMVSLLRGMSLETLTMEQALELLKIPRTLGQDADGNDVVAHLGKFGPYIKRGKDSRSLEEQDHIFTIDLPRALHLLAQEKKTRRGPKELKVYEDVEALDGVTLKICEGRFGVYVSDGEYNATIPKHVAEPLEMPLADLVNLIVQRRAKGPAKKKKKKKKAKKKAAKKKTKKKATKKKATKKKAAKKKTTKKKAAKKKTTKKKAAKKKTTKKKVTKKKATKKTAAASDGDGEDG